MRKCILILIMFVYATGWLLAEEDQAEQTKLRGIKGIVVIAKSGKSAKQEVVKLYNKLYAVIIGIDKYENLPPNKHLKYAVSDAKAVAKLMHEKFAFEKIYELYDEDATRDKILALFLDELAKLDKEDGLFVFWASHGLSKNNIGVLIPYDGDPNLTFKNVTMNQIKTDISTAVPAKHIFFVIDACYSGIMARRSLGSDIVESNLEYLKEKTRESVRQVLTAGTDDQEVLDGGKFGHSVFAGRFIQKLNDVNDYVTAQEVATHISQKVFSDARDRGHTQTPVYGVLEGLGDFVFVPNRQKTLNALAEQEKLLEEEVKRLDELAQESLKMKDDDARARIERERTIKKLELKKAIEAKKQIEELERLRQEEIERLRQRQYEEEKRAQEQKTRLERMKMQIKARQQELLGVTMSVSSVLGKLQELTQEKNIDVAKLQGGHDSATKRTEQEYIKLIKSIPPKSMFEKKAVFKARIKAKQDQYESERADTVNKLDAQLAGAFVEIEGAYREPIAKLADKIYTLVGDEIGYTLGNYDAESEIFPVIIYLKKNIALMPQNLQLKVEPDVAEQLWNRKEVVLPEVKIGINASNVTAYVEEINIIDHKTKNRYKIFSLKAIERQRMVIEQRRLEEQERKQKLQQAEARKREAETKRKAAVREFKSRDAHLGIFYRNASMGTVYGLEIINLKKNMGFEIYMGKTNLSSLSYVDDYKVKEEGRIFGMRFKGLLKNTGMYFFITLDQARDLKLKDSFTGQEKTVKVRSINMGTLFLFDWGFGYEWRGEEELKNFAVSLEMSFMNGYSANREIFDDPLFGDFDTGASKFFWTWFYYGLNVSWRF